MKGVNFNIDEKKEKQKEEKEENHVNDQLLLYGSFFFTNEKKDFPKLTTNFMTFDKSINIKKASGGNTFVILLDDVGRVYSM